MEELDSLDRYLAGLRRSAKLSVEELCLRTKIQARFVNALEAGQWSEIPSNTHLRAFSLALAKACGGDEAHAAALVRRLLAATSPVQAFSPGGRGFDTLAPPPSQARTPLAVPPRAEAAQHHPAAPAFPSPVQRPPASTVASASARLRSLPLALLLSLLALAGTLSYVAAWGVEHWRQRGETASAPAAPEETPMESAAGLSGTASAGSPAALAETGQSEEAPAAAKGGLTLRARRPCWLVLDLDGKRLPTITMKDGDKLNWGVAQRAVLLAGNLGALRVWWQGDNLGYLGDLGQRANAIVFEIGKQPRLDKSAALKLPAGVPE